VRPHAQQIISGDTAPWVPIAEQVCIGRRHRGATGASTIIQYKGETLLTVLP